MSAAGRQESDGLVECVVGEMYRVLFSLQQVRFGSNTDVSGPRFSPTSATIMCYLFLVRQVLTRLLSTDWFSCRKVPDTSTLCGEKLMLPWLMTRDFDNNYSPSYVSALTFQQFALQYVLAALAVELLYAPLPPSLSAFSRQAGRFHVKLLISHSNIGLQTRHSFC